MVMFASPNLTTFSLPPWQALTTNFFPPCTSLRGELHFILLLFIATFYFFFLVGGLPRLVPYVPFPFGIIISFSFSF
tara:strand:- start:212 stop:442 length:231 start_codon:yes stop_codon:yes gene_type:complete